MAVQRAEVSDRAASNIPNDTLEHRGLISDYNTEYAVNRMTLKAKRREIQESLDELI